MPDLGGRAGEGTERTPFLGERFAIESPLGRGGMGVVYQAIDRDRNTRVALKTLRNVDAAAIYRFKQEFRALADVTHPNLVTLHELFSVGEQWFFTMELVEGKNFLDHVRDDGQSARVTPPTGHGVTQSLPSPTPVPDVTAPITVARARLPGQPSGFHPARLRAALRQLAEGVFALHEAGKLHRDIKPTNVLVDGEGRVVLLDFGLVTELGRRRVNTSDHHGAGTPEYMSPEQAAQLALSTASDWYSVGCMLYEAMTGRLPFIGLQLDVLMDKQRFEPPPPEQLIEGLPEDLCALCVDLMRRRPGARPSGLEVLRRLGSTVPAQRGTGTVRSVPTQMVPLMGRERHLEALALAFSLTRDHRAMTVNVHGSSGMGKSALINHFLEGIVDSERAVVLTGRCYERESVPYKALDSLVDALSRYLVELPRIEADALMPREIPALARVFPVLRRVEAVAEARRRGVESPDPLELRRRAFGALRELLARLAAQWPLVLYIDDLQWADVDSAMLLSELLRPPDPPALLLIASFRSEDAQTSVPLRAFLDAQKEPGWAADTAEVVCDALSPRESLDLALVLLGEGSPQQSHAESIAKEAGGNPFFITELVRYLHTGVRLERQGGAPPDLEVTLDEVLEARLRRLPDSARRLLEIIAVAGRPVELVVACRAADLGGDEQTAIAMLRTGHLVRARQIREQEAIETYHDRIREAVMHRLEPDAMRSRHHRLALELEVSGYADPETLAIHLRAAGDLERAGEYAAAAAAQAADALAFDRASRLYRLALELHPATTATQVTPAVAAVIRELRVKLGEAQAGAGRGPEAAEAFLAAAPGSSAADSLELQRRAAEQLLRSGHIDRGVEVLRAVLGTVGMDLTSSPRRALASLLLGRARLRLRGLGYKERDTSQISAEDLRRIDVCWSVAIGLTLVDTIQGTSFQVRHLLLALEAGEPYRVARALTIEAVTGAVAGPSAMGRSQKLFETSLALAEKIDNPHVFGLTVGAQGMAAFNAGQLLKAREHLERSEVILRSRCTGVAWEVVSGQMFALWTLYYLGELAELSRRVPALLREAIERGDRYAATDLCLGVTNAVWLIDDAPEDAASRVDEAMGQWSNRGYHLQHYYELLARCHIDLYTGAGKEAFARVTEGWPALKGSLLLRVQVVRVEALHLRARAALAAAVLEPNNAALWRSAARDARKLRGEDAPCAKPLAALVEAGVQVLCGEPARAVALLATAERELEAASYALHAAVARRRRGELVGGDEGAALVRSSVDWMTAQRVKNPQRLVAMLAPGFRREP